MGLDFYPVPKPHHKRRAPKRGDRNKFPKPIRDKIRAIFEDTCQECGGKGIHIHHVCFRSQGGRGVFTNGLLLCNDCHKRIHLDNERAMFWKKVFKKKYGSLYYMDKEDLEQKQLTKELKQDDKSVREWVKHNGKLG